MLLGNINTTQTVIYDPVANAWTGTGTKGDISSEETRALLRDVSVLTVECNPAYPKASQRYVPGLGAWVDAGSTQVDLVAHAFSTEIGPAILLEGGGWGASPEFFEYLTGVVGGIVIGSAIGGLAASAWGITAPFWLAFAGSALILAVIWRSLLHIAHADEAVRDGVPTATP